MQENGEKIAIFSLEDAPERSESRSQRMTLASLGDGYLRSSHSLTKLVGAPIDELQFKSTR